MLQILNFFNIFVSSGGGHGEKESLKDIIFHHLMDSKVGLVENINQMFFKEKLFGIFDMTITKHVLMMWVSAVLCLLIFIPVARKLKNARYGSKSKWVNMWEVLVSFVHDEIVEPNFGHGTTKKAMPYFCTLFFFILFCNLLGMIPGLATATGNVAVTAGLASLTLLLILGVGIVKQGPISFFIGLVPKGVPALLYILMIPIELIGMIIKPFALTVRLFANMTAGHIVILIFIYLIILFQSHWVGLGSLVGVLMIDMLELLVAFIQAYIFTTLSAMFIGASLHAH